MPTHYASQSDIGPRLLIVRRDELAGMQMHGPSSYHRSLQSLGDDPIYP